MLIILSAYMYRGSDRRKTEKSKTRFFRFANFFTRLLLWTLIYFKIFKGEGNLPTFGPSPTTTVRNIVQAPLQQQKSYYAFETNAIKDRSNLKSNYSLRNVIL